MVWLGFVTVLALLLAFAFRSAARVVSYGRACREFFRSYAEDWRAQTIEVVINGTGEVPIVTHGRTHAFSVRTASGETIAFPAGLDLITAFSPSPDGPTLVLRAGHRCGLYISTRHAGAIRVDRAPHMILHTIGWSPYVRDSGAPQHWRWSRVALVIVASAALAALVGWSPVWGTPGWIALGLLAWDLARADSMIIDALVV